MSVMNSRRLMCPSSRVAKRTTSSRGRNCVVHHSKINRRTSELGRPPSPLLSNLAFRCTQGSKLANGAEPGAPGKTTSRVLWEQEKGSHAAHHRSCRGGARRGRHPAPGGERGAAHQRRDGSRENEARH